MRESVAALTVAFADEDWLAARRAAGQVVEDFFNAAHEFESTVHPLGFIHVLLASSGDDFKLRLHLWPVHPLHAEEPVWPVHRHAWSLTSLVVRGTIRDNRYRVVEDPAAKRRLYETGYAGGRSVLTATDRIVRCDPDPAATAAWTAGSTYEVPTDAYHSSVAVSTPGITVMRSGPSTGAAALVVGDAAGPTAVSFRRRPLSTRELEELRGEFVKQRNGSAVSKETI